MDMRLSFEEGQQTDLSTMIAELPIQDSQQIPIPIKKLSDDFDNCFKNSHADNDHMKVYLRVRPVDQTSSSSALINTINVLSDTTIVTTAPEVSKRAQYSKKEERLYAFNKVFDQNSVQQDVFDATARPLLDKLFTGENCVLFAYGMTNSGKTYTIQGTNENPGIFPKLITAILDTMATYNNSQSSLAISMLEIYHDKIYDLLVLQEGTKRDKLNIRDAYGKVEVAKLSSHSIQSVQEASRLIQHASERRAKSHTLLNAGSSRSHAVYSITLTRIVNGKEITSVFQVVDLAGAERGSRTKASQAQQKEANMINMSLMQLWRCLQCMKKRNNGPDEVIPFRESKLTHLLMPILCRAGLDGVALVTCVNPQNEDYDETITILANASIAFKIKEVVDIGRVALTKSSHSSSTAESSIAAPIADNKKRKLDLRNFGGSKKSSLSSHPDAAASTAVAATHHLKGTEVGVATATMVCSNHNSKKEDKDIDVLLHDNKRLRTDLSRLEEENEYLRQIQVTREHEIRVEVSKEMTERSSALMQQISELQRQITVKEKVFTTEHNVTKSVRKVRRKQIEDENDQERNDQLKEAESEIERIKLVYEREIGTLRDSKLRLENECLAWKKKFEIITADATIIASQGLVGLSSSNHSSSSSRPSGTGDENAVKSLMNKFEEAAVIPTALAPVTTSSRGTKMVVNVNHPNPANAASEFSKRIQRDDRFKTNSSHKAPAIENDENANSATTRVNVSASKVKHDTNKSSSRSPLVAIKDDGNSPMRAKTFAAPAAVKGKKSSVSFQPSHQSATAASSAATLTAHQAHPHSEAPMRSLRTRMRI